MKKIFVFFSLTLMLQIAIAQTCVVCDDNSTVSTSSTIGLYSTAFGAGSVSIGSNAHTLANSMNSIAIGSKVETVAGLSMVIGTGPYTSSGKLSNSISNSLMIGFNSQFPTFFVSEPEFPSPEYTNTGRIAIGNIPVNEIQAKLHIREDDGYDAAVFIEPVSWTQGKRAILGLGDFEHGITGSLSKGLIFSSATHYRFLDGKVGIGAFINDDIEAKVHIKCAQNEQADLFIEPYIDPFQGEGGEGFWQASLYLGTKEHGVAGISEYGLVYSTSLNHVFQGGNVGIGTFEPAALFHVQDMEGDFLYDQSRAIISSNGYSASYSLVTGIGEQWDISHLIFDHTLNLDHTLNFKYNDVVHMAATQEEGLFVHNNLTVCDLDHGNPYSYHPGSIHVFHNQTELDKKAAEFVTHEGGRIFFVPKVGNFGYNKLSRQGDVGIFWSNTTSQTTEGGRLIIAPHYSGPEDIYSGIFMTHEGNVGIHVSEPSARLDVRDRLQISGWDPNPDDPKSFIIKSTQDTEVFVIRPTGETFIANKLWAQEVQVVADVWSDFVFSESYKLRPLEEVEDFILENKHLPDVPSEKEIKEDGLNLGEMDAILLQKIEELTLYIIEQEKIIEALSQEVELIKSTSQ